MPEASEKAIVSNILIPLSRKLYLGEFEAEALNLMLPISISDSLKPRAENMNQININGFEGKMKKEVPKCMIIVNQVSQSDLHIYCENGNTHVTYAMTILVNHIYECYLTLGVLHECYRPVVEGFKDFIGVPLDTQVRAPKVASRHEDIHWYQAIHSVVSLNQKNQCLVIIQTIEMAAKIRLGSYSDRILQVIDYIPSRFNKVYREYIQSIGIVEEIDNISTDVICCSPGYELFRLPNLSTVLDFAFKIHSDLGLHFGYAIVNGSKVSM